MAELLVFQAGYLAVDKLAPLNSKGLYYGIANIDSLGLFIGPLIGCGIYEAAGIKVALLSLCLLLVVPGYVFIQHCKKYSLGG